ncbi:hypothetical protein GCM10009733_020920 [Nonomuraea maheshkhaliensis]|uniref:Uncharacterized protein n=1 Tax=Nonomuraea maheshkhaliensis TaxID=419590 RepID=A0ABN2EZT1_9ACTN
MTGTIPPQTADTASAASPSTTPAAVPLDGGEAKWLHLLWQIQAKRAELDRMAEQAIAVIQNKLGSAEEGTLNGVPAVRWQHIAGGMRFDSKEFFKAHPDLIPEKVIYSKAIPPSRRFKLLDPPAGAGP